MDRNTRRPRLLPSVQTTACRSLSTRMRRRRSSVRLPRRLSRRLLLRSSRLSTPRLPLLPLLWPLPPPTPPQRAPTAPPSPTSTSSLVASAPTAHHGLPAASATKPSTRHLCTTTVPSRVAAQHQLLPA